MVVIRDLDTAVGVIINIIFEIVIVVVVVVVFGIVIVVVVIVNCEGSTLSGRTLSSVRVLDTAVDTIVV